MRFTLRKDKEYKLDTKKNLVEILKRKLKKGDVVVMGGHRSENKLPVHIRAYNRLADIVTRKDAKHAGIYDGKNILETSGQTGTVETSIADTVKLNKSLTVLEPKVSKNSIKRAIKRIRDKLGVNTYAHRNTILAGVKEIHEDIPIPETLIKREGDICSSLIAKALPKLKIAKKDKDLVSPADFVRSSKFKKKLLVERIKNSNSFKIKT